MAGGLQVVRTVIIHAPPERVLKAFFDPRDLREWWQVWRSITVPRPLGTYSIEWGATEYRDEVLGRLGGAFQGTVLDYRPPTEFFVADAYWLPPEGEPIGPMALEVRCAAISEAPETQLTVRQGAEDEGPRWQRYFTVVAAGWRQALGDLKQYLDAETRAGRR